LYVTYVRRAALDKRYNVVSVKVCIFTPRIAAMIVIQIAQVFPFLSGKTAAVTSFAGAAGVGVGAAFFRVVGSPFADIFAAFFAVVGFPFAFALAFFFKVVGCPFAFALVFFFKVVGSPSAVDFAFFFRVVGYPSTVGFAFFFRVVGYPFAAMCAGFFGVFCSPAADSFSGTRFAFPVFIFFHSPALLTRLTHLTPAIKKIIALDCLVSCDNSQTVGVRHKTV
jgi:hypothetical protein